MVDRLAWWLSGGEPPSYFDWGLAWGLLLAGFVLLWIVLSFLLLSVANALVDPHPQWVVASCSPLKA